MAKLYSLLGVDAPFDPFYRFATSWLLPPWVLFAYRALMCLYAFTVSLITLGWPGEDAVRQLSYFTVLTYWGIAFYFLFAALHTLALLIAGAPFLNRWPRPLQALHSIYYSSIVTYPFLVTIVYWAILSKPFPTTYSAWRGISQHVLNAVFAFLEIILPRTAPPPWLHVLPLLILLVLYVALSYVTFATQGFFPYDFLDPRVGGRGRVTIFAFGILAAVLVIFLFARTLIWLRMRLTERRRSPAPASPESSTLSDVSPAVPTKAFSSASPDLEKQQQQQQQQGRVVS
ncbi:MAG: hypothetical protein M1815_006030 [Lichina confinis]|nr:MAG: hypothetical protein M1815_006030 [Lichina confinis]